MSFSSGYRVLVGRGTPAFHLAIHTERGLRAVQSLEELSICEAYMDADLDIDGNLLEAVALRELLNDQSVWITLWRKLQPILTGRRKANETCVQNHYDLNNIQLQFIDTAYNKYTPGVFEKESETLEVASERKHRLAYEGLGIGPGSRILDIGFGWGSFLRYAARRGVHVTGITLSRHQLAYVQRELVEKESLPAELVYSDFFDFEPEQSFDAIAMLGVIEELADYPRVMQRIARWVKPGGRVYLDFMAATQDFVFPAFISKYIYQGRTSRVYVPKFMDAVTRSRFELLAAHNDRRNYYRPLAHRSYSAGRVFQFVIAWLGTSSLQRGPLWWAGHHRHHHRYADTKEDVHSRKQIILVGTSGLGAESAVGCNRSVSRARPIRVSRTALAGPMVPATTTHYGNSSAALRTFVFRLRIPGQHYTPLSRHVFCQLICPPFWDSQVSGP
jgi:cyclopropane-fatty-acyl-phospholipid synthase